MKKRSLIASIAMLLVSAIVLSTSTYAWFSAGATVSANDITASITQSDGSIEISADNATWGSSVTAADLKAVAGNAMYDTTSNTITATKVSNLATLSANPVLSNGNFSTFSFVPASLTSNNGTNTVTSSAAVTLTDGKYVFYKLYVRAGDANTQVTVTPSFSVSGDKTFVIGAVAIGSDVKYYGSSDEISYYPLKASQSVVDSNNDCIITTADTDVAVGTQIGTQITTEGGSFTITPGTTGTAISVWIWAEGQEASCETSVSNLTGEFDISIATV
jgi:hypothetical protein